MRRRSLLVGLPILLGTCTFAGDDPADDGDDDGPEPDDDGDPDSTPADEGTDADHEPGDREQKDTEDDPDPTQPPEPGAGVGGEADGEIVAS